MAVLADLIEEHLLPVGRIKYVASLTPRVESGDINVVARSELAVKLVEAAFEANRFLDLPLLIIGGGVAGFSAAMKALDLGVPGVKIANGKVFCKPQSECTHRYLHPTIYDWPNEGCAQNEYDPGKGNGLYWTAGIAKDVVRDHWMPQIIKLRQSTRLQAIDPIPDESNFETIEEFTGIFNSSPDEQDYGMVLICVSPIEDTKVGDFPGFPFWDEDHLDAGNCGSKTETQKILIGGSGDGALQDFLRVCCPNDNMRQLHDKMEAMFAEVKHQTRFDFREHLQRLSYRYGTPHPEVHAACLAVVRSLINWNVARRAVSNFIDEVCHDVPTDREVSLVFSASYFKKCYLLNRFLVLLIANWRERTQTAPTFVTHRRLIMVREMPHGHEVGYERSDKTCSEIGPVFDRVIPRFGTDHLEAFFRDGRLELRKVPKKSAQKKPTAPKA